MRIAFQGERGAYSEAAVVSLYGETELLTCQGFAEVFEAVATGKADRGLLPFENSHTGSISENRDLLLSHSLVLVGEAQLRIRHNLLALPGVPLERIRRVHSHVQALMQCEAYLRRHGLEAVADYDTAGSAKRVSERKDPEAAAIASARAAQLYGLQILEEGIETTPTNHTRFVVIAPGPGPREGPSKTSLVLTLRNTPGALHGALGALALRGINLTQLESRPSREAPWEYLFFLDLEGHQEDPNVASALEALRADSLELRVFGSYPVAPKS
ncbi:MAG: prephenate dehydratase [Myxococcota bacterium]|nr:prephenate dehydratase [Myxococcota bacterium]